MTREEIAANLKAARLAAGVTQRKLGIALGYEMFTAQPMINKWESGHQPIPIHQVRKIAEILKIPIDQLVP